MRSTKPRLVDVVVVEWNRSWGRVDQIDDDDSDDVEAETR
jgi:hypothetical protein